MDVECASPQGSWGHRLLARLTVKGRGFSKASSCL